MRARRFADRLFWLPTLPRVGSGMPKPCGPRVGRLGAVVVTVLCVTPVAVAEGASCTRARATVRAWLLNPAPLYPTRPPAAHRHVNVLRTLTAFVRTLRPLH